MIRIIAGKWRSLRLDVPDLTGLRPTTARVRETVFNWLASDVVDAQCLDLFAGSGGLSFEALSRGAAHVVCIDSGYKVCEHLRQTAEKLDAQDAVTVVTGQTPTLDLDIPAGGFNLVFLDPPFEQAEALLESSLNWLHTTPGLLADDALIYIELPRRLRLVLPPVWAFYRHTQGGQVQYGLLEQVLPTEAV